MGKTLYMTDLDGTLLNKDQKISEFTASVINNMVGDGLLFSYATARSYVTASKAVEGITARIPVIVYNGVFIVDSLAGGIIHGNYFAAYDFDRISGVLSENGIYPIVYTHVGDAEKYIYHVDKVPGETKAFLKTREGDVRDTPVKAAEDMRSGRAFYFTCIDKEERLYPAYLTLKNEYSCYFQRDIYSGDRFLEIVPTGVSKATAILELKKSLVASVLCRLATVQMTYRCFRYRTSATL